MGERAMIGLVDIAGLASVALWATFRLLRLIAICYEDLERCHWSS